MKNTSKIQKKKRKGRKDIEEKRKEKQKEVRGHGSKIKGMRREVKERKGCFTLS